jgi:hypothetical protein
MRALSTHDILRLWEQGRHQHPVDQALTLLALSETNMTWEELAALPIGARDARLLSLRALTFGQTLRISMACPECGERLEFTAKAADLQVSENMAADGRQARELTVDDTRLRFRLANSWDLAAAAQCRSLAEARRILAQRCVLQLERDGVRLDAEKLTEPLIMDLAARMTELDPQAELTFDLQCPACRYPWEATFDIVSFFWRELVAQAHRLLLEVAELARMYHWREADILAMSSRRRKAYLEMGSA